MYMPKTLSTGVAISIHVAQITGAGGCSRTTLTCLIMMLTVILPQSFAQPPVCVPQPPVDLGSTAAFAVLAGSTVTNTGPSMVTGDLGVSLGTAVTGFPPGVLNGQQYTGNDPVALQAKLDLTTAFNDTVARLNPIDLPGDISTLTLYPCLYNNASSVMLSAGNVTFDALGDPHAIFIIQIGTTLTTAPGTEVILINGAKAANIFWQVGSSATLGTNSFFKGNILAQESITLNTGVTLEGRALTQTGAVTLDTATISIPCVEIEAHVYLGGAAIDPGGAVSYILPMRADLNNARILPGQTSNDVVSGLHYTPPGQPYNVAPWFYNGNEGDDYDSQGLVASGNAGYPPTVVDWVLVSLRETFDGAPVCRTAALLHNNGAIEFITNGFPCCTLDFDAHYFLVIEHRNHLILMSHEPLPIVNNIITYDFRNQQSSLNDPEGFGIYARQKEILPGEFAMLGGNGEQHADANEHTDITDADRGFWIAAFDISGEYNAGDYNLNGEINVNDRTLWEENNGKFTSVPSDYLLPAE
jgi:hypothetical protein